ncbi:hypothetical protein HBH70_151680 [Parastagonospora nodorum]|nr:hypothetical protein HBH53_167250 [Parastagonospora nodorum]KAH3965470.1 hypothetical protein HBH51_150990 [Parastagonospora nodorum]KAH4000080.1 hypothetical protein HBI10_110490 [Parastagonospora nodorum]KAH4022142.1 hypothetical protein HBI13_098720 [Parastagonospora nodorum]KAH4027857.1 hypothetical protein HBI09_144130 [Parastagonospora nodorum]
MQLDTRRNGHMLGSESRWLECVARRRGKRLHTTCCLFHGSCADPANITQKKWFAKSRLTYVGRNIRIPIREHSLVRIKFLSSRTRYVRVLRPAPHHPALVSHL